MSVITGVGGAVDGVGTVRSWQVSAEADIKAYVASNTKGATGQVIGNTDWSGRYEAYGHTPQRMPGETASFQGDMSNMKGVRGEAIVDEAEIVCDIEAAEIFQHTVSFSGNAPLQRGTFPASDISLPNPPTSIGCVVKVKVPDGSPAADAGYVELGNVTGWTLRLRCDNQGFVTSETGGGMQREKGNLSGEVTIPMKTDDFSYGPQENDIRYVRLYVDAVRYWLINAVMFSAQSDMLVDHESGAIVGVSLNAAHTSHVTINSAGVLGSIIDPATSVYWPF